MAAAALRSSVGHALRRAALPRLSPSSSAGAASAISMVRARRYGSYDSSRSMFDPEAYSRNPAPRNPDLDKADGFFTAAAVIGTLALVCLMDGEGLGGGHYFGWCQGENAAPPTSKPPPRMSRCGRRR